MLLSGWRCQRQREAWVPPPRDYVSVSLLEPEGPQATRGWGEDYVAAPVGVLAFVGPGRLPAVEAPLKESHAHRSF